MRARNLKPGFFKNETLAEFNPLTRILFVGLWCLADREGRLEDRPKRIKADVLPYDNYDVDKALWDLHGPDPDQHFVLRYEIDGRKFIQIWNFKKHQNPHMKESASSIPAPDLHHTSTILAQCNNHAPGEDENLPGDEKPSNDAGLSQHSTSTVQAQYKHGTSPADSLSLDSLNLIPDSLNPISSSADSGAPKKPKGNSYTPEFEEVCDLYPRKEDKKDAFKAWSARLKEGITPDQIITATKNYIAGSKVSDPSYFKMLKTFLGPGEHIKFWLKPPENTVQQKIPRGFQDIINYGGSPNDH